MAKLNGKTKYIVWIVTSLITIGGTWTAIVMAWGDQKAADGLLSKQIETTGGNVVKLEKDGCKPAQAHTTKIAVIETRLESIEIQQGAILKQGEEILTEIKKK